LPVDAVDDRIVGGDARFDPREALLDAAPAGADEVDEQCKVVDAGVPLGEQVTFDPFEPADQLVHEAADLGEVAADGAHLLAQPVLERVADAARQRRLELGGGGGERLDLLACPLERRVELRRLDPAGCGLVDARLCALDRLGVHLRRGYRPDRTDLVTVTSDEMPASGRSTLCRDTSGGQARRYGGCAMDTAELDYELPPELIAQEPAARRDASRLLVYERATGTVRHRRFAELPDELHGELVVVNDTRVVPARIPISSPRGEVLLLERIEGDLWEGLARPTRRLKPGTRYGPVELLEHLGEGRWRLRLDGEPHGDTPLPPYITTPLADPERYQTVYARDAGSAAAPTAGLHFTPELLAALDVERVTLHVGLDTFRPVNEATLEEHEIHGERYAVAPDAWQRIEGAERVLAVGTTTTRVLETIARGAPLSGRTELFITPGFEFRRVDALLTNFHLPRSTLLALVMAFAGIDEIRRLYALAVAERYRFYSFGDAMLIL
jgi:S-adenosylmethionine:tRNA ribosyltransferase-isomerase